MAPWMIGALRDVKRSVVAVGVSAAMLLMGEVRRAEPASPAVCRQFHQECSEARAAGYRDVGICNVERLECPPDPDASARKRSHDSGGKREHELERADGERSVGP